LKEIHEATGEHLDAHDFEDFVLENDYLIARRFKRKHRKEKKEKKHKKDKKEKKHKKASKKDSSSSSDEESGSKGPKEEVNITLAESVKTETKSLSKEE